MTSVDVRVQLVQASSPAGAEVMFRRCVKCGERNVVKGGWFVCGVCEAELPQQWNF
jgi:hypothetical protein